MLFVNFVLVLAMYVGRLEERWGIHPLHDFRGQKCDQSTTQAAGWRIRKSIAAHRSASARLWSGRVRIFGMNSGISIARVKFPRSNEQNSIRVVR